MEEPILRMRFGHIRGYLLFDPTLIRRVLVDDSQHFSKDVRSYHKARILVGKGLVTSEGNQWRKQRRIMHRPSIVNASKLLATRW